MSARVYDSGCSQTATALSGQMLEVFHGSIYKNLLSSTTKYTRCDSTLQEPISLYGKVHTFPSEIDKYENNKMAQ